MKPILFFFLLVVSVIQGNAFDSVYADVPMRLAAGECRLSQVDSMPEHFVMNYRVSVPGNKEQPGEPREGWSLVWNRTSPYDCSGVTLSWGNTDFGGLADRPFLRVDVFRMKDGLKEILATADLEKGVNFSDGYNSVMVERWEDHLYVGVGAGKEFIPVADIPYVPLAASEAGILAHRDIDIRRARLTAIPYPQLERSPLTLDELQRRFSSSADLLEGFWRFLDRSIKSPSVVPGGFYTIAVVKSDDGASYDILYIDGAEIHSALWRPLTKKGRLIPSGFTGNYDLEWLDADGHPLARENYAVLSEGALLQMSFPLLSSEIRFRKVRLQ